LFETVFFSSPQEIFTNLSFSGLEYEDAGAYTSLNLQPTKCSLSSSIEI